MTALFLLRTQILRDCALRAAVRRGLSPARVQKADAFVFEKDVLLSLGAGAALDYALFQLGLRERDVKITIGENGKPMLAQEPELFFNLSHSGEIAVCAVSSRKVGVDVEQLGEADEALIRHVSTDQEIRQFLSMGHAERTVRFYRMWTVKESFMKYLGTGLTLPPRELEADLDSNLNLNSKNRVTIRRSGVGQNVFFQEYAIEGYALTVCAAKEGEFPLRILTDKDLWKLYE